MSFSWNEDIHKTITNDDSFNFPFFLRSTAYFIICELCYYRCIRFKPKNTRGHSSSFKKRHKNLLPVYQDHGAGLKLAISSYAPCDLFVVRTPVRISTTPNWNTLLDFMKLQLRSVMSIRSVQPSCLLALSARSSQVV